MVVFYSYPDLLSWLWNIFWGGLTAVVFFQLGRRYERKQVEKESAPTQITWAEPTLGEPSKTPD